MGLELLMFCMPSEAVGMAPVRAHGAAGAVTLGSFWRRPKLNYDEIMDRHPGPWGAWWTGSRYLFGLGGDYQRSRTGSRRARS